ncbi:MAG: hypothetical protein JNL23_05355 [Chitinophagaceae bacterium]|nr:hypothetical protein [Chitinophagaceae bacterium]
MTQEMLRQFIYRIIDSLTTQIPAYKDSVADWTNCQGNVAVCIIDDAGNVYGKIWGDDKLRGRKYYDLAYRKASQVWITGYKTGEYERLVYTDKLNYRDFGIPLPELMGWEGGQPVQLDTDTKIYCGFSGFKGVTDVAIVQKAVKEAMQ